MRKRLIAAVGAAVLALLGVVLLVGWAGQANDRAFAGTEMTKVLQVSTEIPSGSDVATVEKATELVELPAAAVADGSLDSLDSLGASARTTSAMSPGELVLEGRFATKAKAKAADPTALPVGMQRLTIAISQPRAGAGLDAGDVVSVYGSWQQDNAGKLRFFTRMLESEVRVLAVSEPGTDGSLNVTLAVKTPTAEKIVNASEFGKVWLGTENDATTHDGSTIITPEKAVAR